MSTTDCTSKDHRFACKRWILMIVLLMLSSGCSFHNGQLSYFNMLEPEKQTTANKKAAEKFWSRVRPIETLSASHYKLGRYYQRQKQHHKAIEEFTKALQADNGFCKAYNGIAMSYDALRQCDIAHQTYEQGLICSPEASYLYNNYACSSLICGKYKHGVALLEQAHKLRKDDKRIENNLMLARSYSNTIDNMQLKAVPAPPGSKQHLDRAKLPSIHEMAENKSETLPPSAAGRKNFSHPPDNHKETVSSSAAITENRKKNQPLQNNQIILESSSKKLPSAMPPILHASLESGIEVSNGNGVTGMAGRTAQYLSGHGFKVRRITNARHFTHKDSTILYRQGYLQVARKLAHAIPGDQNLELVDSLGRSSIGVRLLLGKDLVSMHFPDDFYFQRLAQAHP